MINFNECRLHVKLRIMILFLMRCRRIKDEQLPESFAELLESDEILKARDQLLRDHGVKMDSELETEKARSEFAAFYQKHWHNIDRLRAHFLWIWEHDLKKNCGHRLSLQTLSKAEKLDDEQMKIVDIYINNFYEFYLMRENKKCSHTSDHEQIILFFEKYKYGLQLTWLEIEDLRKNLLACDGRDVPLERTAMQELYTNIERDNKLLSESTTGVVAALLEHVTAKRALSVIKEQGDGAELTITKQPIPLKKQKKEDYLNLYS